MEFTRSNFPKNYFELLLREADKHQLDAFKKYFGIDEVSGFLIEKTLRKLVNSTLQNRFSWKKPTYEECLIKTLVHYKIDHRIDKGIFDLEEKALQYFFNEFYKSLSDESREKLDLKIQELAFEHGLERSQLTSLSGAGLLGLAGASGFGLYTMASTVIGGVTSVVGITLPFAFYTGMSTILSFITGPIGVAAAAGYLLWANRNETPESALKKYWNAGKRLITGDFKTSLALISYLASIRITIEQRAKDKIKRNQLAISEIEGNVMEKSKMIKELTNQLRNLESEVNTAMGQKKKIKLELDYHQAVLNAIDEHDNGKNTF